MQYREMFNLMAKMIRGLIENAGENFLVAYSALTSYKEKHLMRKLQKELPELSTGNDDCLKNSDILQHIAAVCENAFSQKDYDLILIILQKLDILLKDQIENYYKLFADKNAAHFMADKNGIKIEKCLNDNFSECNLQLLPNCACKWSHNSREKIASNTINVYLKNCFYIPLEKLGEYQLEHVYLNRGFESAKEEHVLKIGMTPLCNSAILDAEKFEKDGVNYFKIEDVQDEKVIKETVLHQLELAKENGAAIMMYPEMVGTEDTFNAIRDRLEEFHEDEKEYPDLILCPTIWKDERNVSIVLDRDGEIVVEQEKQHPYPYQEEGRLYLEGIVPDNIIRLIHCEGIGRIAILICKDALQREYLHMILEQLKVTLILIPSFSTGSYDFGEMMQMCRAYDCCAVWINTCSVCNLENVSPDKVDIKGRFLRTGKAEEKMKNMTLEYKACKKEKGLDCKECLYIAELLF